MDDPREGSAAPGGSAPDLEWVEPEELEPADDPLGDTLRAANARYALALATADAETLCDLFEPDGAIIDGSGPDVLGHEGLRDMAHYARERFEAVAFDIDVEWTKPDPLDPCGRPRGGNVADGVRPALRTGRRRDGPVPRPLRAALAPGPGRHLAPQPGPDAHPRGRVGTSWTDAWT